MAQTVQDFLTRLKRAITSFYAASYSTDTDTHAILEMFSTEFASGSQQIEDVYNNLYVLTAETLKLYDNFGTYFAQAKDFTQNVNEDRYVAGSGSIPAYRKTVDFLLDAAMHGSTIHALQRTTHAFTLINPDISELYAFDRWKLKAVSGSISQTDGCVLTISPDPGWKRNVLIGGLAVFMSGSGSTPPQDGGQFIVSYLVTGNTQNQITLGLAV